MSKKPRKVEEPKAAYAAKPAKRAEPASTPARADEAAFRRIADKLFSERRELLRKLAQ